MSKQSTSEQSSRSKVDPGLRVLLRNQGVYSLYQKILGIFWITFVLMVVSIAMAGYFFFQKTPPQYAQAAPDGNLIQSIPLDKPNMDESAVFDLVRTAIRDVNRYDYINYKTQIPEAQEYFTISGWKKYTQQLSARATLKNVEQLRDIVTVDFTGPATLVNTSVANLGGQQRFLWEVEQPVVISYIAHTNNSSNGGLRQEGVVRAYVVRVPYTSAPRGAAIQIYNLLEKTKPTN